MKKLLAIILAALMLVPMLAACDRSGTQKGDYKVAMITDYGDITDQSFNQTTYESNADNLRNAQESVQDALAALKKQELQDQMDAVDFYTVLQKRFGI